jgi:hypothetical protein
MSSNTKTPINLNTLSDFELNKIFIQEYCRGQMTTITFEPQRSISDIMDILDMKDDKCYFTTSSGSKQDYNYTENACTHIGEYSLNIQFHGEGNNCVTISSADYPDLAPVTSTNGNYKKAICLLIIMIFDRYRKSYIAEDITD